MQLTEKKHSPSLQNHPRLTVVRLNKVLPKNKPVLAGGSLIVLLSLLALTAPILKPMGLLRDPLMQFKDGLNSDDMPLEPNRRFLLGTDSLGRDVLSRVVFGARISLLVGVASMLTATLIGVSVGLFAGYYGGKVDTVLMRLTEIMMAIPALLLGAAFAGFMDGKIVHLHPENVSWHFLDVKLQQGPTSIFLVIGLLVWTGIVRVVRAEVMSLKVREFVQASQLFGASSMRVLLTHILPNIIPTLLVVGAMNTANTILLEVGLSYLGIGAVQLPQPSWGSMIREGQSYFISSPHLVLVPGTAIVLTVLGFNLLGQGLQETFDPLRRKK